MATIKHTHATLSRRKVKPKADGSLNRERIGVGRGLMLEITSSGAKTWRLRYQIDERSKMLWLGSFAENEADTDPSRNIYSLSDAMAKAVELKNLVKAGIDPKQAQENERKQNEKMRQSLFGLVADEWFLSWQRRDGGKSDSTKQRTRYLLDAWLKPELGNTPVDDIDHEGIAKALLSTAKRLNQTNKESKTYQPTINKAIGVVGSVFSFARRNGYLSQVRFITKDIHECIKDNPLHELAIHNEQSHPAITTPDEFSAFLKALWHDADTRRSKVVSAALKLSCYLFLRQGELRFLRWDELDLSAKQIAIPEGKEGKKTDSALIVPLADQVLEIIEELRPLTGHTDYIFTCQKNTPLSENTISKIFRIDLGYRGKQDPHGLRASARTMLDERLGYPPQVIEVQLDHAPKETHGKAYNRTKYLEQRREMLQHWADYIDELRGK